MLGILWLVLLILCKFIPKMECEEMLMAEVSRWGAFWMSEGLMFLLNTTGALPAGDIHAHLPELASWFVVLAAFTWVGVSLCCTTHHQRALTHSTGNSSNSPRRHSRNPAHQPRHRNNHRLLSIRIRQRRRRGYQGCRLLLDAGSFVGLVTCRCVFD